MSEHFLHIPPWNPAQDPPWLSEDVWVEHVGCVLEEVASFGEHTVSQWTCGFGDFLHDIGFVEEVTVPEDPDRGDKPTLPSGRYAVDVETIEYHTLETLSGVEYDTELRIGDRTGDYQEPP